MTEQVFKITGMHCAGCAGRVKKAAGSLPGVSEALVNLPLGELLVKSEKGVSGEEVVEAVRRLGFGAEEVGLSSAGKEDRSAEGTKRRRGDGGWRVALSVALLVPLVTLHYGGFGLPWVQAVLALAIAGVNYPFFTRGVRTVLEGAPGMDALVSMGSGVALVDGWVHLICGMDGMLFLESAGMILTFISVGKWLERRATQRTGQAVEKLSSLLPSSATVLRDGREENVPIEQLRVGETVLVRPGDRVPADGEVTEGISATDESALTGESMPVEKQCGAEVYAGTVNLHGVLSVRVTKSCRDSTLSGVIRLVSDAAAKKAPVARMADRIARVFVPAVVTIAALTALAWLACGYGWDTAMARVVAVLVISCPCALGLATPVAIMVGAGKGAEWGILFRSGEAMEAAGRARCVVLDKTGTLTTGKPTMTDVLPRGCRREELLRLAVPLENGANHPLAHALLDCGEKALQPVVNLQYIPGRGMRGEVQGMLCALGNARLMQELGVEVEENTELQDSGKTVLYAARDGKWLGCIAVADAARETAREAVTALQEDGLRALMITGDNERTAKAIAGELGLREWKASAFPRDKEELVRHLQEQGERVAMVGDGVNDAPALTRADVGIAIGAGTDIAVESAGIILMRSEPVDIPRVLALSRATLAKIRQNLFLALIYNVLAIPLAAGVFFPIFGWQLHPAVAAVAMGLSSLCVVTNALRLRAFAYNPASPCQKKPGTC